jgi:hypothetical protein
LRIKQMYIVCIYKNNICQFKNILPLHHNTLNMVASYIHNQLIALAQHQTLKTQFFLKRRFFSAKFSQLCKNFTLHRVFCFRVAPDTPIVGASVIGHYSTLVDRTNPII